MALAMLAPIVRASLGWDLPTRVLLTIIVVVLSGPFLATLDRGNIQGLIPILLFSMAVLVLRSQWIAVGVLVGVMGALKLYPLALILVLVGERQWKAVLTAVTTFAASTLMFLVVMSDNFWPSLARVFTNNIGFGGEGIVAFMSYNTSFAGGLAHWAALVGLASVSEWIAANGWVIAVVYLSVVGFVLSIRSIPMLWRILLSMTPLTASTPLVYPYVLNWVLAASALLIFCTSATQPIAALHERPTRSSLAVVVGLALVTAPYPFFIPGSAETGAPAGFVTLMVPVASLLILGAAVAARARAHSPDSSSTLGG